MKRIVLLLALATTACLEPSGPQANVPERLLGLTPGTMSGEPGFELGEPVRVQVVDGRGRGVAGERVSFAVVEGGGSVTPETATTDSAGVASASWRLGPQPGTNVLRARYGDQEVTIRAAAAESRGARIVKLSGGTASALLPAGCTVGEPVVVKVTDAQGQPVQGASVGFELQGEGSTATPEVATTDAGGLARTVWRAGFAGGTNVLRAVLRTSARPSVEFSATSAPAAPNGFSVIGNKIFDPATCQPMLFRGAARPALQWWPTGDDRFAQIGEDVATLRSWGFNVLRLPVSQTYWIAGTKQYDAGYKARVIDAVRKARAVGLAVIVDLHAGDRGENDYAETPNGYQMADVNHSLPFWKDVAATFKDDGGVIFELYNEPHDISWEVWLNGGDIPTGPLYAGGPVTPGFKAIGMQQLYDAVRAAGARNLVMISGLHWGYYLNEVPQHRVKGYNIMYAAHPYDWPDKQSDVWERDFGVLAATDPVVISEFGAYECSRLDYYRQVLDYADRKGMSWIAWAWWTPPPVSATYTAEQRAKEVCKFPALITDWNGTPSASGQVVKDRLASYRR